METLSGKVQTVLGQIDPSDLGKTLTHEHLSLRTECLGFKGPHPSDYDKMKNCPFTLENYGWIWQNPYSHLDNVNIRDAVSCKAIIEEMKNFKSNGGGTVVENSTYGLDRDLQFVKSVSVETGVHIVAGTGYYLGHLQKDQTLKLSIEEIATKMKTDLLEGVDGIKCGVIGELGCSSSLHPFEIKVLRASGEVQSELKCPVIIHPGRDNQSPTENLRVFQEAGGIASKTVMSHLERTIFDVAELCEFASMGSYCEFDLFGIELSYYMFNPLVDMPSDAQRIKLIHHLLEEGFGDKIVIAHDIHTKHRLQKFGGHGFSHILMNTVPKMLQRGFTQKDIDNILINNPKTWLTY